MKINRRRSTLAHAPKFGAGFTLIELLMVIAIIGILAALIIVSLQGAGAKARDTKRKTNARNIASALSQYHQDNNLAFPIQNVAGGVDITTPAFQSTLSPTYLTTTNVFTHDKNAKYITDNGGLAYGQAWELESVSEPGINTGNGVYNTNSANVAGVVATPAKGNAISFGGVNTSVTIPNNAVYQTAAFSTSFWVKPNVVAGTQVLVHKNVLGAGWRIWLNGATVTADYPLNVGVATGSTPLTTSNWYHIVVTYASGSVIVYVNGVAGTPVAIAFTNATNTNQLIMGTGASLPAFSGTIDGLRLYNRVLTPTEIGYLWNGGYGSYGSSGEIAAGTLAGGWRFDEGTGTTINSYSTTVNNGLLANGTWVTGNSPLGLTPIGTNILGKAFVTYGP